MTTEAWLVCPMTARMSTFLRQCANIWGEGRANKGEGGKVMATAAKHIQQKSRASSYEQGAPAQTRAHLPYLHWACHEAVQVEQHVEVRHLGGTATLVLDIHLYVHDGLTVNR